MMETTVRNLAVPGATLHSEVRGSGPVLPLISGGICFGTEAEAFAARLHDVLSWT